MRQERRIGEDFRIEDIISETRAVLAERSSM
jgi:hypothetical protein